MSHASDSIKLLLKSGDRSMVTQSDLVVILARLDEVTDYAVAQSALVAKAVDVLQRHATPAGLSDHQALTELYGIFDGPEYRAARDKDPSAQPTKPCCALHVGWHKGNCPKCAPETCNHVFAPHALSESGEPVTGRRCVLCHAPESLRLQSGTKSPSGGEPHEVARSLRGFADRYDPPPEKAHGRWTDVGMASVLRDAAALIERLQVVNKPE